MLTLFSSILYIVITHLGKEITEEEIGKEVIKKIKLQKVKMT